MKDNAFLQFIDSDERQIHQISESTKNRNKRTKKMDITSHGGGREIPAEKDWDTSSAI